MGVTFFYLAALSEAEISLLPSLSLLFYPTNIFFCLADTYKAQKLYISMTKPTFNLQICSLYLPASPSDTSPSIFLHGVLGMCCGLSLQLTVFNASGVFLSLVDGLNRARESWIWWHVVITVDSALSLTLLFGNKKGHLYLRWTQRSDKL